MNKKNDSMYFPESYFKLVYNAILKMVTEKNEAKIITGNRICVA